MKEEIGMLENNNSVLCLVTCPGGSNVSLMAYKAATLLEKEGYGKFVRLGGEQFKEKDLKRLADAAVCETVGAHRGMH